jgi:hypothetical protein
MTAIEDIALVRKWTGTYDADAVPGYYDALNRVLDLAELAATELPPTDATKEQIRATISGLPAPIVNSNADTTVGNGAHLIGRTIVTPSGDAALVLQAVGGDTMVSSLTPDTIPHTLLVLESSRILSLPPTYLVEVLALNGTL